MNKLTVCRSTILVARTILYFSASIFSNILKYAVNKSKSIIQYFQFNPGYDIISQFVTNPLAFPGITNIVALTSSSRQESEVVGFGIIITIIIYIGWHGANAFDLALINNHYCTSSEWRVPYAVASFPGGEKIESTT